MMRDEIIRRRVHQAVEAYAAHVPDDPHLAGRILALEQEKEAPIMKKKLSIGAVLVIALLLATVTALAVGLNAYEIWQESFNKMNTTGEVYMLTDPTENDMPVEEALAIARRAIQEKYGTPDAELDAMGVYPTFIGREWEWSDGSEPDEWRILYSAVTDQDIDLDDRNYGTAGEYRVYINAEEKVVTLCYWYTDNFWTQAQRIWDVGSHDVVYKEYADSMFYSLTPAEQARFEQLFRENGYEVRDPAERYTVILKSKGLELLFRMAEEYDLDPEGPQIDAAWAALEERCGLNADLMRKYFFQASRLGLNTGTDDIVICYNYYGSEYAQQENQSLSRAMRDFEVNAKYLGFYLVSFRPGTTEVETLTHLPYSVWDRAESVTEGLLLQKNDWVPADLLALDEAVEAYDAALRRMDAADVTNGESHLVRDAVHRALGADPQYFTFASEKYDVAQWFSDETAPARSAYRLVERDLAADMEQARAEAAVQYGEDFKQWPLEVQARLMGERSIRREGELTREEAIEKAKAALVAQEGENAIGADWTVGVELFRDVGEGGEWSRWMVTIHAEDDSDGWWVEFYDTGADWRGTEVKITNYSEGIG